MEVATIALLKVEALTSLYPIKPFSRVYGPWNPKFRAIVPSRGFFWTLYKGWGSMNVRPYSGTPRTSLLAGAPNFSMYSTVYSCKKVIKLMEDYSKVVCHKTIPLIFFFVLIL